jgi:predicted small lipoprotein YifL
MKALIVSVALSLALSWTAAGWGGPLQGPMLPPSNTVTDAQSTQILEFMTRELKFVEGSFINEYTSQTFTGTSAQVARFIALVKESKGWEVAVIFRDLGNPKAGLQISSGKDAGKIAIVVNLGREDFLLKDFAAYLQGVEPVGK